MDSRQPRGFLRHVLLLVVVACAAAAVGSEAQDITLDRAGYQNTASLVNRSLIFSGALTDGANLTLRDLRVTDNSQTGTGLGSISVTALLCPGSVLTFEGVTASRLEISPDCRDECSGSGVVRIVVSRSNFNASGTAHAAIVVSFAQSCGTSGTDCCGRHRIPRC